MLTENLKTNVSVGKDKKVSHHRIDSSVQGEIEYEDFEKDESIMKFGISDDSKKSRESDLTDITGEEEQTIFRNYFLHSMLSK